jgi:tetratricopeptide (TPR) repeat protein
MSLMGPSKTIGVVLAAALCCAQVDPQQALIERSAWEALNAGKPHVAAEAFKRALATEPKNARLHFGAGVAASLERRDADARSELERALFLDPKLTDARIYLGPVLYRMGDLLSAIRQYETLLAEAPGTPDVATTLERWRREMELHDRMQHAVGNQFTVNFEGPPETALAEKALESLDRAYWRVGQTLSVFPAQPISVVLYTTEQFSDITRSPKWAAGAFDGVIRVPMRGALDKPEELDRVLAHEFTHAVVRTLAARGVPTWLNEGLATALETGELGWAEKSVAASDKVPLRVLQSGFGRLDGAQAQLAYATSALAARRLLDDAGGVAVVNLIRDLGEGIAFDAAFLHRFGRTFADFQASL